MYQPSDHTFALCAYKNSDFLPECLDSLLSQTVKTNVIVATSTPNKYIEDLCAKHNIPLFANSIQGGIASDWNFAIRSAGTRLVTIAHQDDVYLEQYAEEMLSIVNESSHPLLYFTGYGELRGNEVVTDNKLLNVKKMMLTPLKPKLTRSSRFIRRRILSMGTPICCPSVTFAPSNFPRKELFVSGLKADLDWQAWEVMSREKGDFLYNPNVLMYHRIHEESETSRVINETGRDAEDLEMFEKFWPKPIAKAINHAYSSGQRSNNL